jgi:PTH1 family peptidyl-tRNA hydrolase
VLDRVIDRKPLKWAYTARFGAFIVREGETLYAKPAKFYNLTGEVVARIVKFYKIDAKSELLVICDDLNLPFGTLKTRDCGSDGGNNGLKSIVSALGPNFPRLRLGTDNEKRVLIGDTDFVLGRFTREEQKQIPVIIETAVEIVDNFISGDFENHKTAVA